MQKISLIAMLALSLSSFTVANAASETTTCYAFKGEKLVSKGSCTVDGGTGAGGMWSSITYQAQDQSTEYTRNVKTFKRYPKNAQIAVNTPVLLCNKAKPINLCYLSK